MCMWFGMLRRENIWKHMKYACAYFHQIYVGADVTYCHRLVFNLTAQSGVLGVALLLCKYKMCRRRAVVGHAMEWQLLPCPMTSPLSLFFWLSNVNELCVARSMSIGRSLSVNSFRWPMVKVTSFTLSGEFSLLLQCSPGRSMSPNSLNGTQICGESQ